MRRLHARAGTVALAGMALLAACESPAPATHWELPRVVVRAPAQGSADELVAYLAKLRGMSESALVTEAARQRKVAAAKDASDAQRLRAAIALSLSTQGEDAEVVSLAEPIAKREGDASLRAMASYVVLFAGERRRLREAASSARVAVREEKHNSETQKQRADGLQERVAQLQQKLDALTELEKSLSDRPPPAQ